MHGNNHVCPVTRHPQHGSRSRFAGIDAESPGLRRQPQVCVERLRSVETTARKEQAKGARTLRGHQKQWQRCSFEFGQYYGR